MIDTDVYDKKNLKLKFLFDKIFSLIGLIAFSPIFILLACMILIEGAVFPRARGPIFVSQKRYSEGKPFSLFKFRSYFTSDDIKYIDKIGTKDFVDVRSNTYTGNLLRKYYLDELPQLFSIFIGKMSFVGPRPFPDKDYERYLAKGYISKKLLRGGLCGPLQSMKGVWNEEIHSYDADEKLLGEYKKRSSLGVVVFDLGIMWSTFRVVMRGEGF